MKKKLMISAMVVLLSAIYAEAPELQKMLPTEWKYMNRYNGERTEQILESVKATKNRSYYSELPDFIYIATNKYGGTEGCFKLTYLFNREAGRKILDSGVTLHPRPEKHRFYEEKLNNLTFYYYIEHESDEYPTNMYLMYLSGDELIGYSPASYNYSKEDLYDRGNPYTIYETYFIPGKKHKIKAVCRGSNAVKDGRGKDSYVYYQLLEKETLGYYLDIPDSIKEAEFYTENFLYDKNDPLKYALIKAFDGDPSTSFVEDSKDNLLYIKVSDAWVISFPGGFSEFKIINGYAKDKDWYLKNNRPKTIKTGALGPHDDTPDKLCDESVASYELLDDTLEWQKCKFFIDQYFLVKDIYKGSMYKDTCIAELDFKYDREISSDSSYQEEEFKTLPIGWLFSSEPDEEKPFWK